MKQAVVFDIDATLADIDHRRKLLDGDKPDWKGFHAGVAGDLPNVPVVLLYRALWESDQFNMVLTSGRAERWRAFTEAWLFWNEIPFGELHMRVDGDGRADHITKKEFLDRIRARGEDVLFAVDDRQQVVDMWRRNGVTCLQCAPGDF